MAQCATRFSNPYTGDYFDESKLGDMIAQYPTFHGSIMDGLDPDGPTRRKVVRDRMQGHYPPQRQAEYEGLIENKDRLKSTNLRLEIPKVDNAISILAMNRRKQGVTHRIGTQGEILPIITQDTIYKAKKENNEYDIEGIRVYFGEFLKMKYELNNQLYGRNPEVLRNKMESFYREVRNTLLRLSIRPELVKNQLTKYLVAGTGKERYADAYNEISAGLSFLEDASNNVYQFHVDHVLPAVSVSNIFSSDNWVQAWDQASNDALNTPLSHLENLSAFVAYENTAKGNKTYNVAEGKVVDTWNNIFGSAYQEGVDQQTREANEEAFITNLVQGLSARGLSLKDNSQKVVVYLHNNYGMSQRQANAMVKGLVDLHNNVMIRLRKKSRDFQRQRAAENKFLGRA